MLPLPAPHLRDESQPLPPAAASPYPSQTHSSSTHAWMRLAKSLCDELLPGVPKGLWPPEIMPDILQEKGLSTQPV